MKKILFLALFILQSCPIFAQKMVVRGIVTLQNSNGTPVPGVQLSAFGATPTVSNTFGQFDLIFEGKEPGDPVTIIVLKSGMEVVNRDEIKYYVLRKDTADVLNIVLCPEGTRDENAARYYGIALKFHNDQINELKEEIKKLPANSEQVKQLEQQLADLQQKWDDSQQLIRELSDKFAVVNLDDADSLYTTAFEKFRSGDIEAAHRILNSEALEKNVADARKELQKLEQLEQELEQRKRQALDNLEKTIAAYKLKAELFMAQLKWDEAEYFYEQGVLVDTTNYDNVFEFAYYLDNQNRHDKAIRWYKTALRLADAEYQYSSVLNNLANLYRAKNDYPAAQAAYQRALEIRERLAATNPQTYEPDVAMTLNNLGFLCQARLEATADFRYRENGLNYVHRSIKILKTCPDIPVVQEQKRKAGYLLEYFETINQDYLLAKKYILAADSLAQQQAPANDIIARLKQSAAYYEKLLPQDPELDYAWELSFVYEHLSKWVETYPEKIHFIQKTIELRQQVHKKFQNENTALQLANSFGSLSWFLLFEHRFSEAETAALSGLSISDFSKPEGFDQQIEWIHTNLAAALLFQGSYEAAETFYKKYLNQPYDKERTWNDAFLADLNELEQAGITHPDVQKIRQLLEKK